MQHDYQLNVWDALKFELFIKLKKNILMTAIVVIPLLIIIVLNLAEESRGAYTWATCFLASAVLVFLFLRVKVQAYHTSGVIGKWRMSVDHSGFQLKTPSGNTVLLLWSNICAIHQNKSYIYIFVNLDQGFILPKRDLSFAQLLEIESLIEDNCNALRS